MNALTVKALPLPRVAAHRRARTHPGVLERAFAVVALFLFTRGLLTLLRLEAGIAIDDLEGDPVMQITWMAVYGVTLALLATRAKVTLQLLGRERWLILLCGVAAVSLVWSVAPGVTFRRTIALFGTTGFGVYLASRYTVAEVVRLASWALGVAVVLSVVMVAISPAYGMMGDGVAWRGIFVHKNTLGRAMALAVLVFLFQIRRRGPAKRLAITAVLALACLVLLRSHSVASMLALVVVVITLPLWPVLRLQRPLAVASVVFALMAVGGAAWWISTASHEMVTAAGKDPTLTGRTGLWGAVIDSIANRLWLGHGYGAFWFGREGESAAIWSAVQWKPAHAHNGILDLGLQLGVVGIALFIIGFTVALGRAVVAIRRTRTAYGVWPLTYLVFMVMINIAESTLMAQHSIFWILYVVTSLWLTQLHGDGKAGPA